MNAADVKYLVDNILSLRVEIAALHSEVSKIVPKQPEVEWLTRRQVARMLGVSMATVDRRKYKRNENGEIYASDVIIKIKK